MLAKSGVAVPSDRRCGPALLIGMAVVVVAVIVGMLMMQNYRHTLVPSKSAVPAVEQLPKQ